MPNLTKSEEMKKLLEEYRNDMNNFSKAFYPSDHVDKFINNIINRIIELVGIKNTPGKSSLAGEMQKEKIYEALDTLVNNCYLYGQGKLKTTISNELDNAREVFDQAIEYLQQEPVDKKELEFNPATLEEYITFVDKITIGNLCKALLCIEDMKNKINELVRDNKLLHESLDKLKK